MKDPEKKRSSLEGMCKMVQVFSVNFQKELNVSTEYICGSVHKFHYYLTFTVPLIRYHFFIHAIYMSVPCFQRNKCILNIRYPKNEFI